MQKLKRHKGGQVGNMNAVNDRSARTSSGEWFPTNTGASCVSVKNAFRKSGPTWPT